MPRDDWHRNGQCQHPRDGARRPDEPAQRPHRDLIPVSHRRHRNDGPPEGVRDAVHLRLGVAELRVVDGGGEDEQGDEESDEEEAETFDGRAERQQQDLREKWTVGSHNNRCWGEMVHLT